MQVTELSIKQVKMLTPVRYSDVRGVFSEIYSKRDLEAAGIKVDFVQDNLSFSRAIGVLRGLHFQISPFAQAKLLCVTRGAIFDVVVDLRAGSPTFGQHVVATISAELGNQIWVPEGFAHGFCTLEPNTEVQYKVNRYYSPAHERGILWSDPALGIAWPFAASEAIISVKDQRLPVLADLRYEELPQVVA
jgi:dTDP-4-dehydrorhamnose 3,5-epimerase